MLCIYARLTFIEKLQKHHHMLYGKGIWTAVKGGFRSNLKKATIGGRKH